MKLLHYFPTTRLTEGGTVRAAIDLCTALARRGHHVIWLTTDDTDAPESWKKELPNTPIIVQLGPLQRIGKLLTKEQVKIAADSMKDVDVVHIHAMWLPSNPQMVQACKRANTPWVLSTHGMLDDWCMSQRGLKKRLYLATSGRAMLKGATTILTTAEEERRQAMRWLPNDNAVAIPLIVDLEPYETVPQAALATGEYGESKNPTVLFLSRIHPKKSIETLISATSILKTRGLEIRLMIAGTGERDYGNLLQKQVEDLNLMTQVQFLGMVVGDVKLSLYALADVFALPTRQENFGLVYPEAMLCETPVITTKGTDIWRELESGGGAFIVDRTPEAFADAIEKLLSDDNARHEAGKSARTHMLEWLDTDNVAMQYEEMYKAASTVHQPQT